ncbi:MAG TPA: phospho-N-acetylmuramoyl-pentapeptide-transferase [Acholeplasmataceae bacterium]|jgi:phospho-N-acetylmuramoyl-pentapeptide-transferase|nr:phospho-N-acetylmuramoyl-pentapeptide-transferase [Acholeplasmataceae bacterium]
MNIYVKSFLYSFIIAIFLFIFFIPLLRRIKFGQTIRKEGPKDHYSKAGTPTMGGIVIILATVISFLYLRLKEIEIDKHYILLLLMPLILYGILGFIDDYLIVVKKNNQGLTSRTKLFFQIIWAAFYFYVFLDKGLSSVVNIFGWKVDLKWGYGILILLMLISSSNAVNLSDGLDGLAGGLIIIALGVIIILSRYIEKEEILIFSLCLLGAVLAFLCYNFKPAKIIMGDTGSLALGASLANLFILLKMEVLLLVVGLVFIIETISVIIQVFYFKITKGKRIFLMAPLHHHYELKGYSETEIDAGFWILGILFGLLGLILGITLLG